jgi:hypothetical protein
VALVELRFAAEQARGKLEVLDLDLGDDGASGLAGAVTRGDDFHARFAGNPRRLGRHGVGAAVPTEEQCQRHSDDGERHGGHGCSPCPHRSGNTMQIAVDACPLASLRRSR